jgi:hypothetical protein
MTRSYCPQGIKARLAVIATKLFRNSPGASKCRPVTPDRESLPPEAQRGQQTRAEATPGPAPLACHIPSGSRTAVCLDQTRGLLGNSRSCGSGWRAHWVEASNPDLLHAIDSRPVLWTGPEAGDWCSASAVDRACASGLVSSFGNQPRRQADLLVAKAWRRSDQARAWRD